MQLGWDVQERPLQTRLTVPGQPRPVQELTTGPVLTPGHPRPVQELTTMPEPTPGQPRPVHELTTMPVPTPGQPRPVQELMVPEEVDGHPLPWQGETIRTVPGQGRP